MFTGSKKAFPQPNSNTNENESWAKNVVKLSTTQEQFLNDFIQAYRIQERSCNLTQRVCARQLRDLSENKIHIQQGSISRMLQKKYIPRDKLTLDVIRMWVCKVNNDVMLQNEGLVSEENQIEVLDNVENQTEVLKEESE